MNYYSDTKRNEVLIKAIVWMILEDFMLRERRQSLQDKRNVGFIEIKVDKRLLRVGEREWRLLINGVWFLFQVMKMFWK